MNFTHPGLWQLRWLGGRFLRHLKVRGPTNTLSRSISYLVRRCRRAGWLAAPTGRLDPETTRQVVTRLAQDELRLFLAGPAKLLLPAVPPRVSVVLVLHNRAELTYRCLQSLLACVRVAFEVILIDNASTDATCRLLNRLQGAAIIRNPRNLGFPGAVNQAARLARSEYLLLLNNDTELQPGSLEQAVQLLDDGPEVGAVGGRLVLLAGRLQEAGSSLDRDGTPHGIGRGDDPLAAPHRLIQDVDYCSAAFLLTRRELFAACGGLDEGFSPGYFEDADYCVRLWQHGNRVVYHPDVVVRHYESASSPAAVVPHEAFCRNQRRFLAKHRGWLAAPRHRTRRCRILIVDDLVPNPRLGSGCPRACRVVCALVAQGMAVTVYPTLSEPDEDAGDDLPREVEILTGRGRAGLESLLRERLGQFDLFWVSRPDNLLLIHLLKQAQPSLLADRPIIYDAEALFALREARQAAVQGRPWRPEKLAHRLDQEIAAARSVQAVLSVAEAEAAHFRQRGCRPVRVLSHAVEPQPTARPWVDRAGALYVGPVHASDSPNADAIRRLVRDIVPQWTGRLALVGRWSHRFLADRLPETVTHLGEQLDLTPYYDGARVFLDPTRYGAGIPIKVIEAAAHGLPIVASPFIAGQLGWRNGQELLVADTPQEFLAHCRRLDHDEFLWQRLRNQALLSIASQFSTSVFTATIKESLREWVHAATSDATV